MARHARGFGDYGLEPPAVAAAVLHGLQSSRTAVCGLEWRVAAATVSMAFTAVQGSRRPVDALVALLSALAAGLGLSGTR